MNLFIQLLEWF